LGYSSVYTVSGGEKAILFSRYSGVGKQVYGEGWHLKIPWLEQPHIFNVRHVLRCQLAVAHDLHH